MFHNIHFGGIGGFPPMMSFKRRETPKENRFYNLLQISPTFEIDPTELGQNYRKISRAKHPDKGGNTLEFNEIQKAYSTLKDPRSRILYFQFGENFEQEPNKEIFLQQYQGEDIVVQVELSFQEALIGCKKVISFPKQSESVQSMVTKEIEIEPAMERNVLIFPNEGHAPLNKIPGKLVVKIFEKVNPKARVRRLGKVLIVRHLIASEEFNNGFFKIAHPIAQKGILSIVIPKHFTTHQLLEIPGYGVTEEAPLLIELQVMLKQSKPLLSDMILAEISKHKVEDLYQVPPSNQPQQQCHVQ